MHYVTQNVRPTAHIPDMRLPGTFFAEALNTRSVASSDNTEHPFKLMKKIIALLAVVTGIGFLSPSESNARDHHRHYPGERRVISRHSCGDPIYAVYTVRRDRHGHVISTDWVRQSHRCRYDRHDHHDHHHHDGPSRRSGFFFSFGR